MSPPTSASRNGEGEDSSEASQQLLGATESGPATASAGSLEARRRTPTITTGAVLRKSISPASPRAASATGRREKWRCSKSTAVRASASALVLLALGLGGAAVLGRNDDGYINYDADVILPDGANRASFPVSRDRLPGWMKYHDSLKATAGAEGATARVLLLGDSITEELLGTSLGADRDWGSTAVWMEYYAYLGAVNLGVSGDQTQHLLWRIQNGELPDVLQPETIMLAIGTNNLSAGMGAQNTTVGVEALVQYLREERPDALVCVMALFPRADPREEKELPYPWPIIDEVNGLLEYMVTQTFDSEKVRFVDCTDRFLVQDGALRVLDSGKILPDNLHLTKDGLDAWADCAEATIHSGLGEG